MGRERVAMEDVEESIEKLRRTYDRTLTEKHKEKLLEINRCQEGRDEGPDSQITRDLLFSLTAVEYEDQEGRWCEIDPLLMPLAEKWSKSP